MSDEEQRINGILSGSIFVAEAADLWDQKPVAEERNRSEVYRLILMLREQQSSGQIDLAALDGQKQLAEDAFQAFVVTTGLERVTNRTAAEFRSLNTNWVFKKEAQHVLIKQHFRVDELPEIPPNLQKTDLAWLFSPDEDD